MLNSSCLEIGFTEFSTFSPPHRLRGSTILSNADGASYRAPGWPTRPSPAGLEAGGTGAYLPTMFCLIMRGHPLRPTETPRTSPPARHPAISGSADSGGSGRRRLRVPILARRPSRTKCRFHRHEARSSGRARSVQRGQTWRFRLFIQRLGNWRFGSGAGVPDRLTRRTARAKLLQP